MRYDFQCDDCDVIYEIEMPMSDVGQTAGHPCIACSGVLKRVFSIPQMIVRGEGKNKQSGDIFSPDAQVSMGRKAAKAGFSAKQYERAHALVIKGDEEVAREVSRRSSNHATQGSDTIRHVGSMPMAKFLAMKKENGGEMPDTDQLTRRGCIFEHEKKNL